MLSFIWRICDLTGQHLLSQLDQHPKAIRTIIHPFNRHDWQESGLFHESAKRPEINVLGGNVRTDLQQSQNVTVSSQSKGRPGLGGYLRTGISGLLYSGISHWVSGSSAAWDWFGAGTTCPARKEFCR